MKNRINRLVSLREGAQKLPNGGGWKGEEIEKYKAFFESSLDIIIVTNLKGEILEVNKAFEEVVGYSSEEVIGKSYRIIMDDENANRAFEKYNEALRGGRGISGLEFEIITKSGDKVIVEGNMSLVREGDRVVGFLSVFRDITERKRAEEELRKSEEKYRSLVESTDDSIYLVDKGGRYLFMNQKHLSRLGLSLDEVVGRKYSEFHSEEETKEFLEKIKEVLRSGKSVRYEHKSRRDNRYYLRTLSPVKDEKGEIIAITVISKDITEIRQMKEELEAKNADLERFTYVVSHDLRSPLITIQGFVDLLRRDIEAGDKEKVEVDLQMIEKAVRKMGNLLTDTLKLSRIGRIVNPPEEVPFGDLVKEALEQTKGEIDRSNVEVLVAEDFPVVKVDSMRIVEVLVNLISNSIKFMGDNPNPRIEIGFRVEGGETVFFVRDNGMGIPKEQLERVFELFYKVDNKSEGTGAGLAIVKKIIEVHGGRIWIESEEGKGCTVYFTLPKK
ncbi:MAG: PAS domain S-box protein [Candidatus Methanospirareceae archaeon]